jgi:hypothetical protein
LEYSCWIFNLVSLIGWSLLVLILGVLIFYFKYKDFIKILIEFKWNIKLN